MKNISNSFGNYHYHPCKNQTDKKGTIIFIHGFATTSEYYDNYFVKYIENDYDYYALQLPGHGYIKYKENEKIKVDFYTNYCVELIKSLNLDKFYLIGHSMGGGLGIRIANNLKNNVIAYIAVTPMNSKLPIKTIFNYWRFVPNNFKKTLKLQTRLYANFYHTKKDENINDIVEKELKYQLDNRNHFLKLKRDMFSLSNLKICQRNEKQLNVPTLVITGKYDIFIPFKSIYKAFNLRLKNNVQIEFFDKSGHLPFQEENEKYIKTVLSFFDQFQN